MPKRTAMTLVEVVAGTALLGTLLVSILLADGRLSRQSQRAALRHKACVIADELLESWWADRETFPRHDSGTVPGRDGWRWKTHTHTRR